MADPQQIPLVKKGQTGTLLDASLANQVIGNLNKLLRARIMFDPTIPQSQSRVQTSEHDAVIIIGTRPG